ncbi:NAD(P)H-binding protein [Pediococcus acidilactici]
MNILIFGATGGIGKYVVKHAKENGYQVTVYVRNAKKISDSTIKIVQGELNNYEKIRVSLQNQDAVIWAVGIPMRRNYKEMISLNGHKTLLKAISSTGVKRLIDWGNPSIQSKKDVKSFLTVIPGIVASILFNKAKQEMIAISELLEKSDIDWTIVRFMAPKNTKYTGHVKVSFGERKIKWNISGEDIAAFMVCQAAEKNYIKSMPIIGS